MSTQAWGVESVGAACGAAPTEPRWAPVLGCEGLYEVSELGDVRSLRNGRLLKAGLNRKGYSRLSLSRNGQRVDADIHVLVLEAFVGPRPKGMHGCHNDGDKRNNHVSNLRWDTPKANVADQILHGTHANRSKSHCKNGHLFDEANTRIKKRHGERRCLACHRAEMARARAGSAD